MRLKHNTAISILVIFLFLSSGYAYPETLLIKGEEGFIKGDYQSASKYFEQAMIDEPDNARILSGLGRTYFHMGRYNDAEESLKKSLSLNTLDGFVPCWNNVYLGKIYSVKKQFSAASLYFKTATRQKGTANCVSEAEKMTAYISVLMYAGEKLYKEDKISCCIIHYNPENLTKKEADHISLSSQRYYDKISKLFHLPSRSSLINIYIYPSSFEADLWEAREMFAEKVQEEIYVSFLENGEAAFLEHEMVHSMTSVLFNNRNVNPILTEGMAEYAGGYPWGISIDKWIKGFLLSGDYIPMNLLAEPDDFRKVNPIISYTESGSFIKFLIDKYGVSKLSALINHNIAWEDIYSMSLSELEGKWLHDIRGIIVTADEIDVINYRVRLGSFFNKKGVPWVGVKYEAMGKHIVISSIASLSPAERFGLKKGDIIKKIDNELISEKDKMRLPGIIMKKDAGENILITVEREGTEMAFNLTIGNRGIYKNED